MEERHAQGPDLTSLYPANTRHGEVRGKRAWFGGGERGKTYSEVPAWALLGEVSCWDDIPPKRSKVELKPLDACHER